MRGFDSMIREVEDFWSKISKKCITGLFRYAALSGNVDILDRLIRYVDIDGTNKQGTTPLLIAIGNGRLRIVE